MTAAKYTTSGHICVFETSTIETSFNPFGPPVDWFFYAKAQERRLISQALAQRIGENFNRLLRETQIGIF